MTPEQIAERFHARPAGSGRWKAKCPLHGGRSFNSLSLAEGGDGRTLLKCWGGCPTSEVVGAVGLKLSDLFEKHGPTQPREKAHPEYIRKALADLWPRLTPRERTFAELVVIRTSAKNLNFAIAEALAMAVECEIVQIVMIEGNA